MRRAILAGLLPLAIAGVIDLAFGVDVTLLAKVRTDAEREAWKTSGWDRRDGVAELYGIVEPPPNMRVIVLDRDRLVHPPEDKTLVLLPLDRRAGEDVLLARSLWGRTALLSAVLALISATLSRARRRATPA